ncbi:glycosyltransferase [Arthrobacter alpinus]|uniref:glycosyltransferase n=1 Tax=Arthrobacter alpinus TaxID=656366 RepID=UPI0016473F24|nr:glycosyltransferase [Arthrobacter alpinus]
MNSPHSPITPLAILVAHPSADLYGSDRMMLESVRAFQERGHHVTVTLPSTGPLTKELQQMGVTVIISKTLVLRKDILNIHTLPRILANIPLDAIRGIKLISKTKPYAIYVNTLTVPAWVVLGRLLRKPVVVHVHEAESFLPKGIKALLTAPLLLATSIVSNSNYSTDVFCSSFPRLRQKVTLIYNAVQNPKPVLPARKDLNGFIRLLYVGRLSERKGIDIAIAALAVARDAGVDASLDVVGEVVDGDEQFKDALLRQAAGLGITAHIRFHGFDADVWPYLGQTDAAIVPSRQVESFGNTLVEALLAGRPVIVSDSSGLREAASGYGSPILVEPGDSQKAGAAIVELFKSWPTRRRYAMADAPLSAEKHDPAIYRKHIAVVVEGLTVRSFHKTRS